MTLAGLVVKEMSRRRLGLVLSVLAAVVATAAYVAVSTLSANADESLRRSILKMGHNVHVLPKDAPVDVMAPEFGRATMPESVAERLAQAADLPAGHLMAFLQRRTAVEGVMTVVTGVQPYPRLDDEWVEDSPAFAVTGRDEVYVGSDAAAALGRRRDRPLAVGDTLTIAGRAFMVTRLMDSTGDPRDIRLYVNLKTLQDLEGEAGRINGVAALGRIRTGAPGAMEEVRTRLNALVGPEAEAVVLRRTYDVGDQSRRMLRTLGLALAATLLLLCGLGIALYMYSNVADRRYEMAVLMAIGYRPRQVTGALLSKVAVVGLAGGLAGLLVGAAVAVSAGPSLIAIVAVRPVWGLWWQAMLFASAVCLAAAVVAVVEALRLDPVTLLRNQ